MTKRQRRERHRRRALFARQRAALGGGVALAATLVSGGIANADTFTVTNNDDTGLGSLRQAVADANSHGGSDRVAFASSVTGSITLASQISVTDSPLEIVGPGARDLRITGNSSTRLFDLAGNTNIRGLTLSGGKAVGGGAIKVEEGYDLHLENSTVTGNDATTGPGGAIWGTGRYTYLTVDHSTISDNKGSDGGGIYASNYGGGTYIADSTITGNAATSGNGGGLEVVGGVGAYGTKHVKLERSTIAGNSAVAGAYSSGGGIRLLRADAQLNEVIVARNSAVQSNDISQGTDSTTAANFSLIQSTDSISPALGVSNPTGLDPKLGPLEDNGGPTDTMLPAIDSPAIDRAGSWNVTTDQRNLPLSFDFPSILNSSSAGANASDIGAVERQAPAVTSVTPPNGHAGDSVTIAGLDLDGASQVLFGSSPAAFTAQPGGGITAVVPSGAGTADVRVVVGGVTSALAAGDRFTYVPPAATAAAGGGAAGAGTVVAAQFGILALTAPVKVGKSSVSFTVSCTSPACSGTGKLTTVEHLRGSSITGLAKMKTRRKTVKAGSKAFTVAAGKKKTVTVTINRAAKKLLRRFHKLPVALRVTAKGAAGNSTLVMSKRAVLHIASKHR